MKTSKPPRKQKTVRTVTDAVSFKGLDASFNRGFRLDMRIWKKVRGSSIMDVHDIQLILQGYELITLHVFIQDAIKKDLENTIETAKRFGITP